MNLLQLQAIHFFLANIGLSFIDRTLIPATTVIYNFDFYQNGEEKFFLLRANDHRHLFFYTLF